MGLKQRHYYNDKQSSCFDWPYSLLSLYILVFLFIFLGAPFHHVPSIKYIFIKAYELIFSITTRSFHFLENLFSFSEFFFLELLHHLLFFGSLITCFLSKILAYNYLSLTWFYIFISKILKDCDRQPSERS